MDVASLRLEASASSASIKRPLLPVGLGMGELSQEFPLPSGVNFSIHGFLMMYMEKKDS